MGSWRRKRQGEIYDQEEACRIRSENPRAYQETWQSTVPLWEKQFCSSVGSIPWRKFLEMKSYMYLYDNVVKWNDSAGEEAFNNAKDRFWAKLKGLPCDISPPNPDIYIDRVDWNSTVDPELFLDLERESKPSDANTQEGNFATLTEAFLLNRSFSCSGWEKSEEDLPKANNNNNNNGAQNPKGDPWERRNEGVNERFNNVNELRRVERYDWSNGATKHVTGWYDSRYKASRFPSNEYRSHHREYRERKRINFAHEKHDLRRWMIKS